MPDCSKPVQEQTLREAADCAGDALRSGTHDLQTAIGNIKVEAVLGLIAVFAIIFVIAVVVGAITGLIENRKLKRARAWRPDHDQSESN
jgi:hypothetical protein